MKTVQVSRCLICGAQGLPFVGMFSACRENGGSHPTLERVTADLEQAKQDLIAILPSLPWYDQAKVQHWLDCSTAGA